MAARGRRRSGWRAAIDHLGDGRWTLLGLWGDAGAVHMALLDESAGEIAVVTYACADGQLSHRRRAASAGDPARARDPRSVRLRADRRAGHAALARSRLLGRARIRSATQDARAEAASLTRSCRSKARACTRFRSGRCMPASSSPAISASPPTARHVVRLEQRLGYVHKGIESLMAGATLEKAARARRRAPPATARSPMRSPSRRPPRPRCKSTPPPRAHLSARADGRARAARQPFRRHRRDLQRRLVRAHACAMRHPARAHACARPMPASATA